MLDIGGQLCTKMCMIITNLMMRGLATQSFAKLVTNLLNNHL